MAYSVEEEEGPKCSFSIYLAEGDALAKQGDYDKAINAYSIALDIQPDDKNCLVARFKSDLDLLHIYLTGHSRGKRWLATDTLAPLSIKCLWLPGRIFFRDIRYAVHVYTLHTAEIMEFWISLFSFDLLYFNFLSTLFSLRSKCHLKLGDADSALKDAESCLKDTNDFTKGLFQKAEALYAMGDFEFALVHYHRGNKLRPELNEFRLGIQKAREAIDNSIGSKSNDIE